MATTSGKDGLFDENPDEGLIADFSQGPKTALAHAGTDFGSSSLTQRQRVLQHILPLQGIKQGDAWRDSGAHNDTLALALKTFDVIIDHTSLRIRIDQVFHQGCRIPEEVLGPDEMRAAWLISGAGHDQLSPHNDVGETATWVG